MINKIYIHLILKEIEINYYNNRTPSQSFQYFFIILSLDTNLFLSWSEHFMASIRVFPVFFCFIARLQLLIFTGLKVVGQIIILILLLYVYSHRFTSFLNDLQVFKLISKKYFFPKLNFNSHFLIIRKF